MKKLVLVTLLMAGLIPAGSGCIFTSDDDDDGADGADGADGSDGSDGGGEGFSFLATFDCPPDADVMVITVTPAGSSTSQEPEEFDCAAGEGEILLDAGDYDVELLPEGDIGEFAAQSDSFTGADGDEVTLDFVFPDDVGFFTLTWTLSDDLGPIECADLASAGVSVVSTLLGPDTLTDDIFDCEDLGGTTSELELGPYSVSMSILDKNDEAIGVADPVETELTYGDELQDLGNFDVVVTLK
jgi:hypothetical protein